MAVTVRAGRPSVTARRVAAYRLGFDRLAAGFGDPAADERLAADVAGAAGPEPPEPGERMIRYLRARTSFFDRVVLNAIERGVTQLLAVGAGYDGRALRYAREGVRWFEVDHPGTQSDKLARLGRLDLATGRRPGTPAALRGQCGGGRRAGPQHHDRDRGPGADRSRRSAAPAGGTLAEGITRRTRARPGPRRTERTAAPQHRPASLSGTGP